MGKSNHNTSGKNDPAIVKPNPYAPDNLFALLPGIQMVWAVSGAAMRVEVDAPEQEPLIDQLPPGEYLILRVTAPIVDTPGFYQVPAPPRKAKRQA